MSDMERVKELEGELNKFKLALMNAKAIEQTYLRFGTVFDELFQRMDNLEKRLALAEAKAVQQQSTMVKALQEKYRNGTA